MTTRHFTQYDSATWRWTNFSPRELACKGTGLLMINEDALDRLQTLRERLGRPMLITSAYRSPEHNANVGGARNSFHMRGTAFDVRMDNHDPHEFEAAARACGFTGFGYYPRSGFMHIDTRPDPFTWGEPFRRSATALPVDTAEAPVAARSTTVQAAAVQIASSGAAAGFGISQLDGLAQTAAIVFAGVIALAALWIMRERIRKMIGGD